MIQFYNKEGTAHTLGYVLENCDIYQSEMYGGNFSL